MQRAGATFRGYWRAGPGKALQTAQDEERKLEKLGDILKRWQGANTSGDTAPLPTGAPWERSSAGDEPACPVCGGTGLLRSEAPLGHPNFGKLVLCRCRKASWEKERQERLQRYSNLGMLSHLTFDTLEPEGRGRSPEGRRTFQTALAAARSFANSDPTQAGWLVLHGPSGSGKTHLAAAGANHFLQKGGAGHYA